MTTDAVGGVWTYSIVLARALCREGVSVTLAVLGPKPSEAQQQEARDIRNLTLYTCDEPLEWMDEPWDGVARSGEFLLDLAKSCRPDVVHLNGYAHAVLPFDCPKLIVAHSCVFSWWDAVKGAPAPARYTNYRRAVAAGLRHADEVVAPTAAMLRSMQRHYGVNRGHVIPNGIESPASANTPKENIVLCAGRLWDEAKNLSTLARAANHIEIPVYVAGSGSGSLERITPLGTLSTTELRSWYQRAAIYASPAYYEPFGLAALEAASYGAALVLGDIESLREVWGNAAIYVRPNDEVALHRAINILARNPALRDTLASRAERRSRRYSVAKQARLYRSLYTQLVRQQDGTTSRSYVPASLREGNNAHRALLSFTNQRLESRQRALPEGRSE